MPRLQLDDTDDVREHFVIVTNFAGGPNEIYVATNASKVLFEFGIQAARGIPVVVEGIVGNRVTKHRNVDWTGGEFFAHCKRSFAIRVAAIGKVYCSIRVVRPAFIPRIHPSATVDESVARKLTVI